MQALLCHPQAPCSVPFEIGVTARRACNGVLHLGYRLTGELGKVRNALHDSSAIPVRRDGLWQSTCLECFLRPEGSAGYYEFNSALNGDWAAYQFDSYREGMQHAAIPQPALEYHAHGPGDVRCDLRFDVSRVLRKHSGPWQLGISAVIETHDGAKSYWALQHPEGKPDFHHRESFVLSLALALALECEGSR
jgi:hypothetical protein